MTFWRSLLQTLAKNPISFFAVLCVAATAAFLGYITIRMIAVLESTGYCSKAIQAERITPGASFEGLTGCIDILKIQLGALATGFHISNSGFVFVLIVLIVVVVAGARASWKISATGMEGSVGKHEADAAAEHVVAGAKEAAAEVKAAAPNAGLPDALK